MKTVSKPEEELKLSERVGGVSGVSSVLPRVRKPDNWLAGLGGDSIGICCVMHAWRSLPGLIKIYLSWSFMTFSKGANSRSK